MARWVWMRLRAVSGGTRIELPKPSEAGVAEAKDFCNRQLAAFAAVLSTTLALRAAMSSALPTVPLACCVRNRRFATSSASFTRSDNSASLSHSSATNSVTDLASVMFGGGPCAPGGTASPASDRAKQK
jgi:hypothetical protein